jgi:hypothetical protein
MDFMLTKIANQYEFILPIFLFPADNSELLANAEKMSVAHTPDSSLPCVNRLFLLLNYQHLMDGVLSPSRTAFRGEKIYDTLTEYVSCLGKSIDDSSESTEEIPAAVMAVSTEEKAWSSRLWQNHQRVLETASRELRGEVENPFIVRNASDAQFYRTVLSSVLSCSKELQIETDQFEWLRNAVKLNQRAGFYVRQSDGSTWNFVSGKRGRATLGALAYTLLKQYTLNHPGEKADEIRDKLISQIHHSWLGEILVTKDRLKELADAWLDCYLNGHTPVCQWSRQVNRLWPGCPLYELKKEIAKGQNKPLLQQQDCPISSKSNKELYDWYVSKKGAVCPCLYYVVNDFYVSGLPSTLQQQSWQRNGVDASLIFTEAAIQSDGGCDTFGSIQVGKNDFAYVSRWWDVPTVEKLINILGMNSYVGKEPSSIQESLDFMIADL